MKRVGKSLGERLGSAALRFVTPLTDPGRRRQSRPASAYFLSRETEQDAPIGDGPTARTERMGRLEAILFLAREPLGTRKLAQLADLADGTEARTLIRRLNVLYDREGCAFRAVEVAGGYHLMSRPKFAAYLRRLHCPTVEVRLSAPAMETLAVVAYRQPVLRATIESIRGVQCGELLRQLMERDLVKIVGRSEELGRPFLYGTTKRFLQIFGLRHVEELPPAETGLPIDEQGEPRKNQEHTVDVAQEEVSETADSRLTEEESTVKIQLETQDRPTLFEEPSPSVVLEIDPGVELADDSDFDEDFDDEEEEDDYDYDEEDEEDFDEDDSEEEFDDDDEEEEEEEEEEEDDDGFQDSDWEEVDDDEEEEEDDWDEEDEEDGEDDEEDDWDDDDEWEEDDDDWDEEDDEEEDEEEDWD